MIVIMKKKEDKLIVDNIWVDKLKQMIQYVFIQIKVKVILRASLKIMKIPPTTKIGHHKKLTLYVILSYDLLKFYWFSD